MTRLDDIEARLAAATPGPWEVEGLGDWVGPIGIPVAPDDGGLTVPDAELIAHAPADLAALVAVVKAVRGLRGRVASAPFEALTRDSMERSLDAALSHLEQP